LVASFKLRLGVMLPSVQISKIKLSFIESSEKGNNRIRKLTFLIGEKIASINKNDFVLSPYLKVLYHDQAHPENQTHH